MNKKVLITIIICILLFLTACQGVNMNSTLDPYEEQINLGYKLINEGKYEEAILAFNKAIEIDSKQVESYIGLADTYVTRGDENTVNDANDALKLGYEQSQREDIIIAYIRLADTILEKYGKGWASGFLKLGYELTKDERIKSKEEELSVEIDTDFINNLYALCEKNEIEKVQEIMKTEDYLNLSVYVSGDEPFIYYSDSTQHKNKGLGIYSGMMLYFGDYVNNQRSGEGIWMLAYDEGSYIFRGKWENDKPNGLGAVEESWIDPDSNVVMNETYSGVLSDGLWNGDVNCVDSESENNYIHEYIMNFNNGIVTVFQTEKDEATGDTIFWIGISNEVDGKELACGMDNVDGTFGIVGFQSR